MELNTKNRETIKQRVRTLLTKFKSYRDNHNRLILAYYMQYSDGTEFSQWFAENKPTTNTIERVSRLLQSTTPALQGKLYKQRKAKEKLVRELVKQKEL